MDIPELMTLLAVATDQRERARVGSDEWRKAQAEIEDLAAQIEQAGRLLISTGVGVFEGRAATLPRSRVQ